MIISNKHIKLIMERRGETIPQFAIRINASVGQVKAWLSGQNPCKGPAASYIEHLERIDHETNVGSESKD